MKKTLCLFAFAAILSFVAGCKSEDHEERTELGDIALKASFSEKSLSGEVLSWQAGDRIRLFAGVRPTVTDLSLVSGEGTENAEFTGQTEAGVSDFAAVYPLGGTYEAGHIAFELPAVQADDFRAPMYATTSTDELSFANILGAVQVPVKGNDGRVISSVAFVSKDKAVSGKAYLDQESKTLILENGDGKSVSKSTELVLSRSQAKTVSVVLPVGIYSEYTIILTDKDGEEISQESAEAVEVKRGETTVLPEIRFSTGADDLSYNETANCYIVTEAGQYSFDATRKGNDTESTITPEYVEVIWSDVKDLISDLSLTGGRISFSVSDVKGNALIGVKESAESEEYLWSWHIWCTDQPKDETYPENRFKYVYTVMDRALGATSADEGSYDAMLYEWGRKDPFTNKSTIYLKGTEETDVKAKWYKTKSQSKVPDDGNNNVTWAAQHPDTYIYGKYRWCQKDDVSLWGNPKGDTQYYPSMQEITKTVYDPCPAGYRVPPKDTWIDWDEASKRQGSFAKGYTFIYDEGKTTWFAAVGSRCSQSNAMYSASGLYNVGKQGYYWTSSHHSSSNLNMMGYFEFYAATVYPQSHFYGAAGYAVRCVKE